MTLEYVSSYATLPAMNPHMAGFFISGFDMTEHAVLFENADIGEGDTVEEAKAQAEAMVNESK